ncbi:MAG: nuclear transport factor 2 family protein [Acidobacteria bacterium]|nr:nuclear transport factor 2 family protein [Acidobacteriota bacterium]
MKNLLQALLITLLAVVSISAQNKNDAKKPQPPSDPKAIIEQVSKLNIEYSFMIQRGNSAEIERVLAADYILTDESGKVFTKTDDLATYKNRTISIESVKTLGQKLRVVGDAVVIANTTINFKGKKDGTEQCTTIWTWRDGRWQIVSDHISFLTK